MLLRIVLLVTPLLALAAKKPVTLDAVASNRQPPAARALWAPDGSAYLTRSPDKLTLHRLDPKSEAVLADLKQLEGQARKYTSSYYSAIRAKIILLAVDGLSNDEIARRLDSRREVVSQWRKRFFTERLAGLEERPRPGRPRSFPPRTRR